MKKLDIKMLQAPRAIVFDWDNTMTYSWPRLTKVMNKTLSYFGNSKLSKKELIELGSIPQKEILQKIFHCDRPDVIEKYWENYELLHSNSLKLIPFLRNTLKFLKRANVYVAVLSNQNGEHLRSSLKSLGLMLYLDNVVGVGDSKYNKPHLQATLETLNHFDLDVAKSKITKDIWFVGDSSVDLEAATNARIFPVLVKKYAENDIEKKFCRSHYPVFCVESVKHLNSVLKALL